MRNRVHFPVQSAFIGPLSSGWHFYNYTDGSLGNGLFGSGVFYNLLQQIDRVQSASYEIQTSPAALKQLGTKGLLFRPLIEPPNISLSFEYLVNGIKNEARLGFDVNYAQFQGAHRGDPYYLSRVCPISGFISRKLDRIIDNPFWVHTCKDFRNLFFVIGPEGREIRENGPDSVAHESDLVWRFTDTKANTYEILSFGNCYISNYSLNASVGEIPKASVSYTCENVRFVANNSAGGDFIPYVDKKTFNPDLNKIFIIPKTVEEGGPSVLLPGDITLTISGTNQLIPHIGVDFNDAKVQSLSMDLALNRENLDSIGYRLPLDRPITLPVYASIKTDVIMGDGTPSGNLGSFFTGNNSYNLTIRMLGRTGCLYSSFPSYQIDAMNVLFRSASFNSSLEGNKTCSINWDVDIDDTDLSKGIFISGRHNIRNQDSLPTF